MCKAGSNLEMQVVKIFSITIVFEYQLAVKGNVCFGSVVYDCSLFWKLPIQRDFVDLGGGVNQQAVDETGATGQALENGCFFAGSKLIIRALWIAARAIVI